MTDLPKIISVDDHVVEPAHLWQERLPAKMREQGPRVERARWGDFSLDVGATYKQEITPDGEYNAFGTPYTLERFPALLEAAPRGQFIGNMPVVELDGDTATGMQHFVFIDQTTHAMRIGWYKDEYVRTADGWRIRRRSTTFMRKHGGFDSGRQHDPLADAE